MTQLNPSSFPSGQEPDSGLKLRPLEVFVFSAVLAIFTGFVVLISSREIILSLIFFGLAFIVALVTLALLGVGAKPNRIEQLDSQEQNRAS